MLKILLAIYSLLWLLALPFLKRSPRLLQGWKERTLKDSVNGPFDIWIQAASGGEAQLSIMILEELGKTLENSNHETRLRILATSGTKQGIDSLNKGAGSYLADCSHLELETAYFPFDTPRLMKMAFLRYSPQLAVIIETELWPSFLIQAKKQRVPVVLVNGRMTKKSFRSYRHFQRFFRTYGPDKIYTISESDKKRFSEVSGPEKVSVLPNIKFDRVNPITPSSNKNSLVSLIPENKSFVLLGSVRKEEEEIIFKTIQDLLKAHSNIIIGLFPKHIERADHWIDQLSASNISNIKRSQLSTDKPYSGEVIVWDRFGELAGAYEVAHAAFVGGSLIDLGGQNFLEPLVFGLRPIIGPYWWNFAWVGREIITSGLVTEVQNQQELLAALLLDLERKDDKSTIREQVQEFFAPQKGGTHMVSKIIFDQLRNSTKR